MVIRSFTKILLVCMIFSILIVPAYATSIDNTVQSEMLADEKAEAKEAVFNKVPLYFQTDYPEVPYGNGTLKSSGCGITSLAMVASYLLEDEILPDELAEEFGSRRDSNMGRMLYAADTLGLTYEKTFEWKDVQKALEEGKVCIALMNEASNFTSSQHFIVLVGMTEEGRVVVNDPYAPNYKKMPKRFSEMGFKTSQMEVGFSGAWIFENP